MLYNRSQICPPIPICVVLPVHTTCISPLDCCRSLPAALSFLSCRNISLFFMQECFGSHLFPVWKPSPSVFLNFSFHFLASLWGWTPFCSYIGNIVSPESHLGALFTSLGASHVVLVVKNPPAMPVKPDSSLIPGSGGFPGGGRGNPLSVFLPGELCG